MLQFSGKIEGVASFCDYPKGLNIYKEQIQGVQQRNGNECNIPKDGEGFDFQALKSQRI